MRLPTDDEDLNVYPGQEDELAALLCMALDGAADGPVRLSLLTRLAVFLHEPDRETDLARLRQAGVGPVTAL